MITVNSFSAYWIREIEVKRYGNNLQLAPSSTVDIYRYLDGMLKYMPKDALKTVEKMLLFSREHISLFGNLDR